MGAGEPTLPGVSIGHNDYGAWGLTIFETDNEDLYVYETNPANPTIIATKGQLGTHENTDRNHPRKRGATRNGHPEIYPPWPRGI